jgi:hypothetical protein
LLLAPGSICPDRLEMKQRLVTVERVAVVTARRSLALREKNRLYALHEELEIGRIDKEPESKN